MESTAAAVMGGRGGDDTALPQQPAGTAGAAAATKRPRPGAAQLQYLVVNVEAAVAAGASKKINMWPSPVSGRRGSEPGKGAAAGEAFGNNDSGKTGARASACMPTAAGAVPSSASSVTSTASSPADFLGAAAAPAADKPKKRRGSRRDARGKAESAAAAAAAAAAAEIGRRWTKEEDQQLRDGVEALGPANWKTISIEYLGGVRSDVQCLHRWNKVLQPGLVKGPWTDDEDAVILACIAQGVTKWSDIAAQIPGRLGKQCRDRWVNHLDPSIKKGEWSAEEDAILVAAQAEYGNKWTEIARLLPGRSENTVKNRWNSASRRRAKQAGRAATALACMPTPVAAAAAVAQQQPPPPPPPPPQQQFTDGTAGQGQAAATPAAPAVVAAAPPAVVQAQPQPQPVADASSTIPAPPMTMPAAVPAPAPAPPIAPLAPPAAAGLGYDPCWDFHAAGFASLELQDLALLGMFPPPSQPQPLTHLPPPSTASRAPTPAPPTPLPSTTTASALPTPSSAFPPAPAATNPRRQSHEFAAVVATTAAMQQQQLQQLQQHRPSPISFLAAAYHQAATTAGMAPAGAHQPQPQPQPQQQQAYYGAKPPSRPGSAGAHHQIMAAAAAASVPAATNQPALFAAPEMEFLHSPTGVGGALPPPDPTAHLLGYHLGEEPHSEFLV